MRAETLWRALATLVRLDIAVGIAITIMLLAWLGWR
jgi:hypothetical protein